MTRRWPCSPGADGLDAIRVVAATAARLLRLPVSSASSTLTCRGESAAAVLIGTQAFRGVDDHPGLTGRPRFVTVSSAIGVS